MHLRIALGMADMIHRGYTESIQNVICIITAVMNNNNINTDNNSNTATMNNNNDCVGCMGKLLTVWKTLSVAQKELRP